MCVMEKNVAKLVREVMDKGRVMSLGVVDKKGPWVAVLNYVYDDAFNVYWISNSRTRHSAAIMKNGKAAASVYLNDAYVKKESPASAGDKFYIFRICVQMEGKARKIKTDEIKHNKEVFSLVLKHRKLAPYEKGYTLSVKNNSWYMLTPSKIELIYEPVFGLKRQLLKLPLKKSK